MIARWSGLLCASIALAPIPAAASPFFTATGYADWLDGASWSGGTVPGPGDSPVIDNGGNATAADAVIPIQDLAIGSRLDAARPADAHGTLELTSADLELAGDLAVAVVEAPGDPSSVNASLYDPTNVPGPFPGNLVTIGSGSPVPPPPGATPSSVSANGTVRVGVLASAAAPGSRAFGFLGLGGSLVASGDLRIGIAEQVGLVSGTLDADGEVILLADGAVDVAIGTSRRPASSAGAIEAIGGASLYALTADYGGEPGFGSLRIGDAQEGTVARGAASIGFLSGFDEIRVGVVDGPSGVAEGYLDAGLILGGGDAGSGAPQTLLAGVTLADEPHVGPYGTGAVGRVSIGQVDALTAWIGVAESDGAEGHVTIGGGGRLSGWIGVTRGDGDGTGELITGGDLGVVEVGVSAGGGDFLPTGERQPFVTGGTDGIAIATGSATGATVGAARSDGVGYGRMAVSGIRSPTGDLSGSHLVTVGSNDAGAGYALGTLFVGDPDSPPGGTPPPLPLTGSPVLQARGIAVGTQMGLGPVPYGVATADGTAIGRLETHGDVESLDPDQGDRVGYGNAHSTGHADGWWSLSDGTYTGHRLTVGLTEGSGTATGHLDLHRMQIILHHLTLGEGASLSFDVESLLAYSVIDAAAAVLDGALELHFGAAPQVGAYDLIVSDALDGITGDFADVTIFGLAPGQSALHGVTTAEVGGSEVAVYRVRIVPEPGTALLFALGVVALAARGRRSR